MDGEREENEKKPQRRKVPRKISPRYLENAALFHLKRYACTAKQLRLVLVRKTRKSLRTHGGELDQAVGWIDELIAKLVRNSLLDDTSFARMKADSLRASGKSKRVIAMKLKLKGVDDELVASHVQRVTSETTEAQAAKVHARKKRLGPFRLDPEVRKEKREKDLAALARAGFSYTVAKKVIDGVEDGDDEYERFNARKVEDVVD